MTMGPENLAQARQELLEETQDRLEKAEQEIERLRGCLRGIVWKASQGETGTAQAVADRCLQKSLQYYPHPIKGAPKDPGEVKR